MNDNPFKIIRPTDTPPENLREDVLGSVEMVMLMMRFMQLFVADQVNALFEAVRVVGGKRTRSEDPEPPTSL